MRKIGELRDQEEKEDIKAQGIESAYLGMHGIHFEPAVLLDGALVRRDRIG